MKHLTVTLILPLTGITTYSLTDLSIITGYPQSMAVKRFTQQSLVIMTSREDKMPLVIALRNIVKSW